ncbi:hypothetical protein P4H65_05535 [Paenibacillus chitinolyticus]|uniref:hypothetical protein n=1 Tax=Paenibacillus chitinolyticus TaxID=79263 RepID=UPI002DBEE03F|nr:hypothetical protein [Paenibacillus chitinolyticus]MEC0245255.1 hypothetical protein [Paenibacillus chitinolyticus]
MLFSKKDPADPRTDFERDLLRQARRLTPGEPPPPWRLQTVIAAAGVTAGGWDGDGRIVLIGSGYSVTDAFTGQRLVRERDEAKTERHLAGGGLTFTVPETGEEIGVFGLDGGDGIQMNADGWRLEVIYPWWPRASVILENVFSGGYRYLAGAVMLEIPRLDGWLKGGFSPSGEAFMVLGAGGAAVFAKR